MKMFNGDGFIAPLPYFVFVRMRCSSSNQLVINQKPKAPTKSKEQAMTSS